MEFWIILFVVVLTIWIIVQSKTKSMESRREREKQNSPGQMHLKYGELVDLICQQYTPNIKLDTNYKFIFSIRTDVTLHTFQLTLHIDNLNIDWLYQTPIEPDKHRNWVFPWDMNQVEIGKKLSEKMNKAILGLDEESDIHETIVEPPE